MQGIADDRGVFVEFFLHEVAEIALADGRTGQTGQLGFPHDLGPVHVEEFRPFAVHNRPVAVFQIRDLPGERGQSEAVGADKHLILAEAHRERCAVLGDDHQFGVACEDHRQGVGAL